MRETYLRTLALIATAMLVAASLSAVHAQPRRSASSMALGDILRVGNVSDAQISPNGQWVVYTVSTIEGNETISTLWLTRVSVNLTFQPTSTLPPTPERIPSSDSSGWPGGTFTSSPLLVGSWNASNPRWSPDSSKIAFLCDRDAQHGLWVVGLEKREPRFIAPVQTTNFF
ncbi:MAG TPA: hypothetical protein VGO73_08075, partial [Pyrinomonadaceae bacterium]|nr:hypothetical protein [Pyrinomonadaceae bacterium]